MSSVNIFEAICIEPSYKKIYHRLGFKKNTTELTAKQRKETDLLIENALSFITLKGCVLRTSIRENNGRSIIIVDDLVFESSQLARFLGECREALLMGATAGSAIIEAIADRTAREDLSAAVVYDATASEMTDAVLDWLMDHAKISLRREGKELLSRRFSAGYGDFKLENQQSIHRMLEMQKIGVTINANFILLPEKSVTAISGIYG